MFDYKNITLVVTITSNIRVHIKRPFEISILLLIRHLNSISDINIAQGVITGCLKSDVGNNKETNLKKIS